MKALDGPYVPPKMCCACKVPVLRSLILNYWVGWGETYCDRCHSHFAWGVLWPRYAQNMARSRFIQEFS